MKLSYGHVALGFLGLHLAIAAAIPIFDDEAYYALWARYPSAGYYDHPPMIAYMIRSGVMVFGENGFGIRFFPVLGMALASVFVGDTARLMGLGRLHACLAVVLFNLGLLVMGVGSFATPDAPSSFFWMAALWSALRAVRSGTGGWWILAGLCLGLGGLSKFTNVFLAIGLFGWLVFDAKGRGYLRTWRPYAAAVFAALALLPYLLWNIDNDWLGFERQGSRLAADGLTLEFVAEYFVILVLLPTPLVAWFALRSTAFVRTKEVSLIWWSMAPLLAYFLYHSSHAQVQANWLIPVQGSIVVMATLALVGRPKSAWATSVTAAVMSIGLLGAAFNPWQPLGTANNPPNQTRGWVQTRIDMADAMEASGAAWIATTDYALTGKLSYHFPAIPVWGLAERQRYDFQGNFPAALCDQQGLLIEVERSSLDVGAGLFETVGSDTFVTRSAAGVPLRRYRLRSVSGPTDAGLCPRG